MIAIDTSFLIDFYRGDAGAGKLILEEEVCLLAPVLFEFQCGNLSQEVKDSITHFEKQLPVFPITAESARQGSKIYKELKKKGKMSGMMDILIMGTCVSHGITKIATRNTKHFTHVSGLESVKY